MKALDVPHPPNGRRIFLRFTKDRSLGHKDCHQRLLSRHYHHNDVATKRGELRDLCWWGGEMLRGSMSLRCEGSETSSRRHH